MRAGALLSIAFTGVAMAHSDHGASQKPVVPDDANWMTKHMAEEHHMDGWDAGSFFTLHDYNSDGFWQADEILQTYGLKDESNKNMPQARKDEILEILMKLLDKNGDSVISRDEWNTFIGEGKTLPDLNTGPGHHGDDEYEYEIHHWEKYHDENTKLEDLTHPEDIEHFKKHEEMEDAQDRLDKMNKQAIIEANIPQKFRRQ
ncbi:Fc.00g002900.m01.CDS01 [Cosmosporella sp. VM-42]